MLREHFEFKETITTILADSEEHVAAAKEGLIAAHQEVERCIAADPFFAATLEAYRPRCELRTVVRMAEASASPGVGPMAAVAGAIAWAGVEAMQACGAPFAVIDNGGDIALVSDRSLRVGIHAGDSPLSDRIALLVPPQEQILGICTSSATVGPSISFGMADAVTVLSRNVASADAWATAICNEVTPQDQRCLERLAGTDVIGVLIVMGDCVVQWGDLPPLVPAAVGRDRITAGRALYQLSSIQRNAPR
ncbi:MAG: UPF0280 family protein [Methanomicrobiales archaeon]|nr:UPF0280 family protein [Methanomicrobiales archaeon]MDI6877204.1 UPF0280 family protein [Methanomicrobiales archaeon]